MADITVSPNMNLPMPNVAQALGPAWAQDINACLAAIDSHNHTTGMGVPIPPAGLDINSDLDFQGNNAINMKTVRFIAQALPITGASPNLNCVYVAGVDLYYNDSNGNSIQLTKNGSPNAGTGNITGLPSTPNGGAGISWINAQSEFQFTDDSGTAGANIEVGSIVIRYPGSYPTPTGNYILVAPPATLATGYTLTLPVAVSTNNGALVTTDTSGTLSYSNVDNLTLKTTAGVLAVKNGYITYEFNLNGNYGSLTLPSLGPDGQRFFNYNATIVNVWAFIRGAGSSGTTSVDLKVATAPGGSYASIFTTKASFASTAAAFSYVDANGVVTPGTGVTAPVLSTTSIAAGSALRMDLTAAMVNPDSVGIVVQFMQRN